MRGACSPIPRSTASGQRGRVRTVGFNTVAESSGPPSRMLSLSKHGAGFSNGLLDPVRFDRRFVRAVCTIRLRIDFRITGDE